MIEYVYQGFGNLTSTHYNVILENNDITMCILDNTWQLAIIGIISALTLYEIYWF